MEAVQTAATLLLILYQYLPSILQRFGQLGKATQATLKMTVTAPWEPVMWSMTVQ